MANQNLVTDSWKVDLSQSGGPYIVVTGSLKVQSSS